MEWVSPKEHTRAHWHSKYCPVLSRNHLSRFAPLPSRLHQPLCWIPREFSSQSKEQLVLAQPLRLLSDGQALDTRAVSSTSPAGELDQTSHPQMKSDNSENGNTKDSSTFSQGTVTCSLRRTTWSQSQRCREATFYPPVWTPRYWQIVGGLFNWSQ